MSSSTLSLGIVIPLKSKMVSRDWHATSKALANTLKSLAGQSDDRFIAVVVGHERPEGIVEGVAGFHSLEIPIPELASGGSYSSRDDFDRILDKNRKIVRGLQLLSDKAVSHWFYLDADDLLDRDFVARILATKSPGVILDGGYLIDVSQNRVIRTSTLSQVCGSTSVLASNLFSVPTGLEKEDLESVPWCRYPHSRMGEFFELECGEGAERIVDPLVGYVTAYGDNCSDEFRRRPLASIKSKLKPYLLGRSFGRSVRNRFSFE